MGLIWWIVVILMAGLFVTVMYAALCASHPISPEKEARLLREQMEERRRRKVERERRRKE